MAAAATIPAFDSARVRLRLAPSLVDVFFAVLLVALFGQTVRWQALIGDGDTGWHIRTGEWILAHGRVPSADLFSFSRAGQPWCAWEWLSDVLFAILHRWHGLQAVAGAAAIVVSLSGALLFYWLLRRGVGAWLALPVTLAAVSAGSIHYLARPHLFSLLFLILGLWLLDEDQRLPSRRLWLLVPLAALWANLHAGFAAWLAILVWRVVVSGWEGDRRALRRYAALAALSWLATLANPYGWRLHGHIFEYLGSQWILEHVQEFQSPRIRTENMLVFAALLLAGLAVAGAALARSGGRMRRRFEASLVIWWGFAALRSARHVPLFAVVAAPVIASAAGEWWARCAQRAPARSAVRLLWNSACDWGRAPRATPWMPLLGALALWAVWPQSGVAGFPEACFPAAMVERQASRLTAPSAPRVLTSDQWADYLIYRLYPRTRVFFDGRSDFYGAGVGEDYQVLLAADRRWRGVMARYGFQLALLPLDWPLGQILERDSEWRVVDRDRQAVLLERRIGVSR